MELLHAEATSQEAYSLRNINDSEAKLNTIHVLVTHRYTICRRQCIPRCMYNKKNTLYWYKSLMNHNHECWPSIHRYL